MDANERRTRASREASEWWVLLQSEQMTKAQREDFIDWLRDSPTNIAEMLRLYQVHGTLEQFSKWADVTTEDPPREGRDNVVTLPGASSPLFQSADVEVRAVETKRRPAVRPFAIAATLAAIAVVTGVLWLQFRGQWITTDRGERREVVLDDGSVLQVDPQTRLNVRFTESQRRVVLSQGRAVFRVAKNPQRPFKVEAGGTTIRAVGTAFGVDRRARDQVVVTVSEGKVAVSATNTRLKPPPLSDEKVSPAGVEPAEPLRSSSSAKASNTEPGEVLLAANEQIIIAMTGTPQPIKLVDSQRELSWAEGRLVFKNDSVADVIAEFNRYNRVQMTVTDPALATRPITGVFHAANPEGFLAFLQKAAPVRVERDDERYIVISRDVSP